MKRPLSAWSDREIDALIDNYGQSNRTAGGRFTLAELKLERLRRSPAIHDSRLLAERIIALAAGSPDGTVTYGRLWEDLNGAPLPKGQAWVRPLTGSLGRLGIWCHDRGLPILSVLVVNATAGELSSAATRNIWSHLRDCGVPVADDPVTFADAEASKARELTADRLATASG